MEAMEKSTVVEQKSNRKKRPVFKIILIVLGFLVIGVINCQMLTGWPLQLLMECIPEEEILRVYYRVNAISSDRIHIVLMSDDGDLYETYWPNNFFELDYLGFERGDNVFVMAEVYGLTGSVAEIECQIYQLSSIDGSMTISMEKQTGGDLTKVVCSGIVE